MAYFAFRKTASTAFKQTDRSVNFIDVDEENTVRTLRDKLQSISVRHIDGGLPVLRRNHGKLRMVGYIGLNELEHALSKAFYLKSSILLCAVRSYCSRRRRSYMYL